MLNELTLTKFRQHESKVVNFTSGLNVIRGANEAGKSTIFEAIMYAFYGARGLRESLDDAVTWGNPASQLKVKLVFTHLGVKFTVTRSKSGAELVGPGVTASGQSEVTNFVTALFGAPLDVAKAILMAKQGGLQESLDGSSVRMIEQLANVQLIDKLIEWVQLDLSTGNTSSLVKQLQDYRDMVAPVLDTAEADARVSMLTSQVEAVKANLELVETKIANLQWAPPVIAARSDYNAKREALDSTLTRLQTTLPSVPEPVEDNSKELEAAATEQTRNKELQGNYMKYAAFVQPKVDSKYTSRSEADAHREKLQEEIRAITKGLSDTSTKIAVELSKKITETACGLCGKDLSQVPEVVEKNRVIDSTIVALKVSKASLEANLSTCNLQLSSLIELLKADSVARNTAAGIPFLEEYPTFPATYGWAGGIPVVTYVDYAKQLKELTTKLAQREAALHQYNKVQSAIEVTKVNISKLYNPVQSEVDMANEAFAELTFAATRKNEFIDERRRLESQLSEARHTLAILETRHTEQMKAFTQAQSQASVVESSIKEMTDNNLLIKKLREARPSVTNRLWNTVLGTVTNYFSQLRGVHTVVGRKDDCFTLDGKKHTSYSGSTQDCLGLAIRATLQKTFMAGCDFTTYDEPASGCDLARESDMLAMLSTCGFEQVLLVTHSDLADAYATNFIQI